MSDRVEVLTQELRDIITALYDEVAKKRKELASVGTTTEEATQEFKILNSKLAAEKTSINKQMDDLKEEVKPLAKEVEQLKGEIITLVAKKGDLKQENITLDRQNKELKKYEEQAWQVLKAKDESLQEREKNITQRESLKPSVHSFLPPVNS